MAKNATRKQFLATVKKWGATVDEDHTNEFYVESPVGHVWACRHVHSLSCQFSNGHGHSWKGEAYRDAISDMEYGLSVCDNPNCDICEEKVLDKSTPA